MEPKIQLAGADRINAQNSGVANAVRLLVSTRSATENVATVGTTRVSIGGSARSKCHDDRTRIRSNFLSCVFAARAPFTYTHLSGQQHSRWH